MSDSPLVQPAAGATELGTLEARGLIRLATSHPELEYLFRHWLIQDAAYGSLLKQERRDLHRRVGEALEGIYPDRRDDLAAVLAMHFEQAGDTVKALDYLVAAGRYALERNALTEAYSAFQRASTLLPEPTDSDDQALRRRRIEVEIGRTKAGMSFVPVEDLLPSAERALPDAEQLGDLHLLAELHLAVLLARLLGGWPPSDPRVKSSLGRVAEIGAQLNDSSLRAMPLALMGLTQVIAGPIREGVKALEEAIPLLEERRDLIGASFARGALGMGYAEVGQFDKAEEAVRYAKELAEGGDLIAQLDAEIDESIVHALRGQLDRAEPLALACVNRAEEMGAAACVMPSAWVLGDVYNRQGRFEEARQVLQRGREIAGVVDRRFWRPTLQAWLGSTAAALGEQAAEQGHWEEALATVRSMGNRVGEAGIRWKRAEALVSEGKPAEALPDFEASAAIWDEEGALPSLARVLRGWGEALRAVGRREEGERRLERARDLFEEMGIDSEAQAVRLSLAAAGPLDVS